MKKRGITPAVEWVLLLGLAVSLGVLFTGWYIKHTETIAKEQLGAIEGDIECKEVSFLVSFGQADNKCNITFINNGANVIEKLEGKYSYKSGGVTATKTLEIEGPIKPNEKRHFSVSGDALESVAVDSYIKLDNNLIVCRSEKEYKPKTGLLSCS